MINEPKFRKLYMSQGHMAEHPEPASKRDIYYQYAFRLMHEGKKSWYWCWPAAFFNFFWLIYRRMYLPAIVFWVVYAAYSFTIKALVLNGLISEPNLLAMSVDLATFVGFGLFRTRLYFETCKDKYETSQMVQKSTDTTGIWITIAMMLVSLGVYSYSIYTVHPHNSFVMVVEAWSKDPYSIPIWSTIIGVALGIAYPTIMYIKEKQVGRIEHDK